ncbi:MAG: methyltransferase domain-containing protein [Gemmataceae bacterium]
MGLSVERIGAGGLVPPWVRHQHVERYRWAAALAAGKRALDAACGTGYGTAALAAAGAVEAVGVDVSPEAVEAANANAARNLSYRTGDVRDLPFAAASFDLYVSFETVEHLDDPARFAPEARRVLAPGGTFVCSTPNRAVTNPGTGIGDRPYNPFHVREYTAAELAELLRAAFPDVTVYGQSLFPAGYIRGLGGVARWSRKLAVRSHQFVKLARMPVDRARHHRPRPYPATAEPEILVAVCRAGGGS